MPFDTVIAGKEKFGILSLKSQIFALIVSKMKCHLVLWLAHCTIILRVRGSPPELSKFYSIFHLFEIDKI